MQKYQNSVANSSGRPVANASVAVTTYPAGTTATIYSDNGVTVTANPILTDSNGNFSFYAADGHYSLTITGSGFTTQTVNDILLEDPANANSYVINGGSIDGTPIGATSPASGAFTTLTASSATIPSLSLSSLSLTSLTADTGTIPTLNSTTLSATSGTIPTLNSTTLTATSGTIPTLGSTTLTATSAAFGSLSVASNYITGNADATAAQNGKILINNTASNYTITIQSGMASDYGIALVQASTGTCTVAAGAGVTLVGATLATSTQGGVLAIVWVAANTYVVKAS